MTARLIYIDRAGRQKELEFVEGQAQLVIGRHPHCDLVTADASVSRRHCAVALTPEGYFARDLGSANGTLVNDEPITEQPLKSQDIIRCGSLLLQFLLDGDQPGQDIDPSFVSDASAALSNPTGSSLSGSHSATDVEALRGYILHLEEVNRSQTNHLEESAAALAQAQAEAEAAQQRADAAMEALSSWKTRAAAESSISDTQQTVAKGRTIEPWVPGPAVSDATEPVLLSSVPGLATSTDQSPLLATTLDLAPGRGEEVASGHLAVRLLGEMDAWLESLEALEQKVRAHRPSLAPGSATARLVETLTAELFAHRLALSSRRATVATEAAAVQPIPAPGQRQTATYGTEPQGEGS